MRSEQKRTYLPLLFACLLADSFIRPFGMENEALPARWNILSGAVAVLILLAVFAVYEKASCGQPSRLAAGVLFFALAFSAGLEILQGQRFYAYVMDRPLMPGAFFLLVLAAALYGADAGFSSLDRAAGAVLALTALSAGILLLSVLPQLRFSNLQTAPVTLPELWTKAKGQLYLPPELVLLPLLCKHGSGKRSSKLLLLAFAVSSGLCILGEMTLGTAYTGREQPVYTIARLGGISVFRRLDAVHIGVWMLLFVLKISLYTAGLCRTGELAFRIANGRPARCAAALSITAALLIGFEGTEKMLFAVQQILLGAGMLLMLAAGWRKKDA